MEGGQDLARMRKKWLNERTLLEKHEHLHQMEEEGEPAAEVDGCRRGGEEGKEGRER